MLVTYGINFNIYDFVEEHVTLEAKISQEQLDILHLDVVNKEDADEKTRLLESLEQKKKKLKNISRDITWAFV